MEMFETLLPALLFISVLTALVTEAFKKMFDDAEIKYSANIMAGLISIVLSVAYCVGYKIIYDLDVDGKKVCTMIALAFFSWLCSQLTFDKVMQAIKQVKGV